MYSLVTQKGRKLCLDVERMKVEFEQVRENRIEKMFEEIRKRRILAFVIRVFQFRIQFCGLVIVYNCEFSEDLFCCGGFFG